MPNRGLAVCLNWLFVFAPCIFHCFGYSSASMFLCVKALWTHPPMCLGLYAPVPVLLLFGVLNPSCYYFCQFKTASACLLLISSCGLQFFFIFSLEYGIFFLWSKRICAMEKGVDSSPWLLLWSWILRSYST